MARAFVFSEYGGPEKQRFIDGPDPTPGPDDLLVEVRAASVNPKDWKVREGISERLDQIETTVGLGREASGVVTGFGESVSGFSIGDEVFGSVIVGETAGLAEFALLRAGRSLIKPPSVSFIDAGAMSLVFSTAYDAVEQLHLPKGATLLITGIGGGVGIAAAQIAIARGIRVVGTASESKEWFVSSVGAIHVPYGDGVVERIVKEVGAEVDAIFDLVGGDELREVAGLAHDRSKVITAGDEPTAVEVGGSKLTRVRSASVLEACLQLVLKGQLNPYVTEVYPFAEAAEAMRRVESGHATGKIVVRVS